MARKKGQPDAIGEPAVPPKPFVDLNGVLGQDRAVGQLRAAAGSGKLHHAWIFHGPVGVGKFTTAKAFAAMVLDPTTEPDLAGVLSPDPESQTQRLIRAGTHPDLHVVTKELAAVSSDATIRDHKQTVIPKAVINEFLLDPAARTRVVANESMVGKVFIVDEAELLDARTQNSLLKLMEEPPAGTIIILVTASEDRLLPTVRSRCQRVAFGLLTPEAMKEWLKRSPFGQELDAEQAKWVIDFSNGSLGVAMLALECGLFRWHTTLLPMLQEVEKGRFSTELGTALAQLVEEQAAAAVKKNPDASKDAANKAWARRMFAFLGEHYRRRLKAAGEARSPQGIGRMLAAVDLIAKAEEQLQANVNMGLLFDNLAAQLAGEAVVV